MKAFVLKGINNYEIQDIDVPSINHGEVLIKTKATGICAADVSMIYSGHKALRYPVIPGHEIAGEIVVSKNQDYKEGQKVQVAPGICCNICDYCSAGETQRCRNIKIIGFNVNGGFCEYIYLSEHAVRAGIINELPLGISFEEACLAEPLACCINAWDKITTHSIRNVLIYGGGTMGILHAMMARYKKIEQVYIVETNPLRMKYSHISGARYITDSSGAVVKEYIAMQAGIQGLDAIIIACKGLTIDNELISLLNAGGTLVLFSGFNKESTLKLDPSVIHYNELTLLGTYGCSTTNNKIALQLIGNKSIKTDSLITGLIPFSDILSGIENTRQLTGIKNIVTYN